MRRGIAEATLSERLLDDFYVFVIRGSEKDDGAFGILGINCLSLVCMNETLRMKAVYKLG